MSQFAFHRITEQDLLRLDAACKAIAAAALVLLPRALFALAINAPVESFFCLAVESFQVLLISFSF